MTKTEQLLIEARDIADRTMGGNASQELIGQVFDVLVAERMPGGLDGRGDEDVRTLH